MNAKALWARFVRSLPYCLLTGMGLYVAGSLLRSMSIKVGDWLVLLATLLLLPSLPWLAYRVGTFLRDKLFFKVRNRILFFYFFAGLVPITLIVAVSALAIYILFINISILIYQAETRTLTYRLQTLNAEIAETLYTQMDPETDPEPLIERFQTVLVTRATDLPPISVLLYRLDPEGHINYLAISAPNLPESDFQQEYLPDWLREIPFQGIILKDWSLMVYSHNLVTVQGKRYYLDLFLPFDQALSEFMATKANLRSLITINTPTPQGTATPYPAFQGFCGHKGSPLPAGSVNDRIALLQTGVSGITIPTVDTLNATDWTSQEIVNGKDRRVVAHLEIPLSTFLEYLSSKSAATSIALKILVAAFYVFLVFEFGSILVGIVIFRSITRSVRHLSRGTEELKRGNFSVEIPVSKDDELGILSGSFNTMARSIQALLHEVAAKKTMQRELEIAKEVQQQFFPRRLPVYPGYEMAGRCLPAREVSGDFYDFIPRSPEVLDVALGDISGKGISAALLMACLQSAIRAQPPMSERDRVPDGDGLSRLVCILNRHLHALTPMEKFATLFYLRLFPDGCVRYCNAGHESGIMVRCAGNIDSLEEGGTVLGIFPEMGFETGERCMAPGDLLAVFTDGLSEAPNREGDQFGKERIAAILQETHEREPRAILDRLFHDVEVWTRGTPQHDDITCVIIRRVPSS